MLGVTSPSPISRKRSASRALDLSHPFESVEAAPGLSSAIESSAWVRGCGFAIRVPVRDAAAELPLLDAWWPSARVRPSAYAWFMVFRMWRVIPVAVTTAAVLGCGGTATNPKKDIRRVAVRYIHAAAVGDGKTACSLLSTKGLADGGYPSRAACRRDYSAIRSARPSPS